MKIFLPCLQTCADALDIESKEHGVTLLFFSFLAEELGKIKPNFKAHFSPSYQKKIYDVIIDTMNNEWEGKKFEEIEKDIEIIRKVHSALELEGEHLGGKMDVKTSIFELARYLGDENEVYLVTNYFEEVKEDKKRWVETLGEENTIDFEIVDPSQAIYLIKSYKEG